MNYAFLLVVSLLIGVAGRKSSSSENVEERISLACMPEATCYGNNPCNACKTCNYCKHCNAGGSCGVCAPGKKKEKSKTEPARSSQCKATTKKGTRCSRSAKSSGYCWQHE